jgi:hypothetical protein
MENSARPYGQLSRQIAQTLIDDCLRHRRHHTTLVPAAVRGEQPARDLFARRLSLRVDKAPQR